MCGIVTVIGGSRSTNVSKKVWDDYLKQKGRGSQGFGYCAVKNGRVKVERAEKESEIHKKLKKENASIIMYHHRFPTSTINVEECAHPIYVSHKDLDYDYYVIHNGVITNPDSLKKIHEDKGYIYNTELKYRSRTDYISNITGRKYFIEDDNTKSEYNDSEALAIEVAQYLDGEKGKIETIGSVAFVAMQVHKTGEGSGKLFKIHYGHNTKNPLTKEMVNGNVVIKSVGGTEIETNKIFTIEYNLEGRPISESEKDADCGYESQYDKDRGYNYKPTTQSYDYRERNTYKGGYSHTKSLPAPTSGGQTKLDWDDEDRGGVDTPKMGYRTEQNYDNNKNLHVKYPVTKTIEDKTIVDPKVEILSPISDIIMESDLGRSYIIEKMVKKYHELMMQLNVWVSFHQDLVEEEQALYRDDGVMTGSMKTELEKIKMQLDEVENEKKDVLNKMEEIEMEYYYKIGGDVEFISLVEDYEDSLIDDISC